MTDFFEKLKKGMDTKNVPEMPKKPDEPVEPDQPEELDRPKQPEGPEVKPELVVASIEDEVEEEPKPKRKRKRKKDKKKKIEIKTDILESSGKTREEVEISEEDKDLFVDEFGQLTVDLYQTDKEVVIQSVIAGVEPEDLDINIEDDLVTIRGKREKKITQEKKDYFYQECYWGQFLREIILPVEVDISRAEASMDQGVLTIRIPKIGNETKKKIVIK